MDKHSPKLSCSLVFSCNISSSVLKIFITDGAGHEYLVLLLSARQSYSSVSDSSPLDLSDCSFGVLFPKFFLISITFCSQLAEKSSIRFIGGSVGSVAESVVIMAKYKQI